MMMVQALRPKITRNSGYISTSGAEASAATQVSVASRIRRLAMQQHAERDADDAEHQARRQRLAAGQQEARQDVLFDDDALEAHHDLGRHRHDERIDQAGADQHLDHARPAPAGRRCRTRTARPARGSRARALMALAPARAARLVVPACPCSPPRAGRPRSARRSGRTSSLPTISEVRGRGSLISTMRLIWPGPVGHHQDAVGELHRFGEVVGDQQRGLLQLLLDLQHLVAEQEPGLLVERGERLVHQQDFRLGGERARHRRRAGACRRTARPDSAARSRSGRPDR